LVEPAPVVGFDGALALLSPHFDDAVLSCGQLLAANPGSLLVTLFSGGPARVSPLPNWDLACHFGDGADVTGARRAENARAAEILGATTLAFDLWDEQYRRDRYGYQETVDELLRTGVDALKALVEHDTDRLWLAPVGWPQHPDHALSAAIALEVARSTPGHWGLYSELPYRLLYAKRTAEVHAQAFAAWTAAGFSRVLVPSASGHVERKSQAVNQYGSQLHALDGALVARSCSISERYWSLPQARRVPSRLVGS
jgi:LmbE family N-acetylglucosaminyl deacetylase